MLLREWEDNKKDAHFPSHHISPTGQSSSVPEILSPLPPQKHHTPSRPKHVDAGYFFSLTARQEMWLNNVPPPGDMHKGCDHALHILSPLGGLPPGRGRTWELQPLGFFQPGLRTLREAERPKCKTG